MEKGESRKQLLEKAVIESNPKAFNGLSRTQKDKLLNTFLHLNPNIGQGELKAQFTEQMYYRGALPHPELMEGFKNVDPDLPNKITQMAIDAQDHLMKRENTVIEKVFDLKKRGQTFAFVISLSALIFGFILLLFDKEVAGYITGGAGLVLIIGMFLGAKSLPNYDKAKSESQSKDDDD